ncbi:MAG TPA: hypothetical protein VIY48_06510 [Candidatus Paceibacterota bacterium]
MNFFKTTYETIVADFQKTVKALENLALREEKKAEDFLSQHVSLKVLEEESRNIALKARNTAKNIGNLLG